MLNETQLKLIENTAHRGFINAGDALAIIEEIKVLKKRNQELEKRIGECEVNYQLIDHMETEIVRLKSKFSEIDDIMIAYFREDARTGLEDVRSIVREALRGLS